MIGKNTDLQKNPNNYDAWLEKLKNKKPGPDIASDGVELKEIYAVSADDLMEI